MSIARTITALCALTAAVCIAADEKIMDIRPGKAPKSAAPTETAWQGANAKALAAAVAPATIAAIVSDEAKAAELCAAVKPNYATDPLKAHQISAATQYVMAEGTRPKPRVLWYCAMRDAALKATDPSVKQFFMDQIRWCACEKRTPDLYAIVGSDRHLQEFADMIARELKGRK